MLSGLSTIALRRTYLLLWGRDLEEVFLPVLFCHPVEALVTVNLTFQFVYVTKGIRDAVNNVFMSHGFFAVDTGGCKFGSSAAVSRCGRFTLTLRIGGR